MNIYLVNTTKEPRIAIPLFRRLVKVGCDPTCIAIRGLVVNMTDYSSTLLHILDDMGVDRYGVSSGTRIRVTKGDRIVAIRHEGGPTFEIYEVR